MKKVLSVLFAALLVLPMSAQISRSGDKYSADGQVMRSKGFASYMQANAEANLANQFKSGRTISNVGWGLFGGGLGLVATGAIAACDIAEKNNNRGVFVSIGGGLAGALVGVTIAGIGAGVTSVGIVCLGVGYDRMHKSADAYIVTKQAKPQAYLSVQTSQNGIGLALNF